MFTWKKNKNEGRGKRNKTGRRRVGKSEKPQQKCCRSIRELVPLDNNIGKNKALGNTTNSVNYRLIYDWKSYSTFTIGQVGVWFRSCPYIKIQNGLLPSLHNKFATLQIVVHAIKSSRLLNKVKLIATTELWIILAVESRFLPFPPSNHFTCQNTGTKTSGVLFCRSPFHPI